MAHSSLDDPQLWLCATPLLDLEDPKLRIRVLRTTQLATSPVQKAVRIHDYIKSLPFGCPSASENLRSGTVLRAGLGDCHAKGTLFVSMLRLVGIPARLRFVTLSSAFLDGIISLPGVKITHAVAEAYLAEQWIQVDTYVTDEVLEGHALMRLKATGKMVGFGIHAMAQRYWAGTQPAHGQYTPLDPSSLPVQDLGVAHDPEHFYRGTAEEKIKKSWMNRFKWMLAAKIINSRVKAIRSFAK